MRAGAFLRSVGAALVAAALLAAPAEAQGLRQIAFRALMADQKTRLDEAFAALPPQRPGVVDVYVLAFAGDGSNPVFLSEARQAAGIMREAMGARGAVILSNDPRVRQVLPLAGASTFSEAAKRLGALLDPSEDVLVAFLTSHGNEAGLLVNLPPYLQGTLGTSVVAQSLAASGVQHRVLIVSACHSGVFIEPAKGPGVMVITAARGDRVSFGCAPEREWTYFGDAFFAQSLKPGASLTAAFEQAKGLIAGWEQRDGFDPSLPQIWVGPDIVARLEAAAAAAPR